MLSTLQIGFIVAEPEKPLPGSQRYYFDLLRTLPSLGVAVRGLVVGDPLRVADPVAGVESFARIGEPPLSRLRNLRTAVRRILPETDVVVSHAAPHAWPVLDLLRSQPLVVHMHGALTREGTFERVGPKAMLMRRFAETMVYRRASRCIVLSEAYRRIAREDYGLRDELIRVVPGAVDLRRFNRTLTRMQARDRLGWPGDRKIVVVAGRLVPTKGLENVIDAVESVRLRVPDVLVMILGDGPLRADLRRRIAERGVERWVRLTGQLGEELALAYRAADLSLVASPKLEAFGLVAVEALASGTPVLVTPVGGLPDIVRSLDEALIMDGSSVHAIAIALRDALVGALALPGEERCAEHARQFDWRTIAARLRDVYREVA